MYKKYCLMQDEPSISFPSPPEKISYTAEKRKIPRTVCRLTDISSKNINIPIVSIKNISPEGCLLSFRGDLCLKDKIDLEFWLPDDSRKIETTGIISYVIKNCFKGINSAGVLFADINEIDQKRIYNFIVSTASSSALKNMQETISKEKIADKYKISAPGKINTFFNHVMKERIPLTVLFENSQNVFELIINKINIQDQVFITENQTDIITLELSENHPSYFSFYFDGGSYYFKTKCIGYDNDSVIFAFPPILYQLEKRACNREMSVDYIQISIHLDGIPDRQFQGRLIDISRRGFLCEFSLDQWIENSIKSGQAINYTLNKNYGLGSFGEIRHVIKKQGFNGSNVLQIGVEAGIKRSDFIFKKFCDSEWKKKKLYQKILPSFVRQMPRSRVVTYNNSSGKKITALLNYTRKNTLAPVVILPPAFGKKKETLSPLVSTLITNYRHVNEDIITIRYDGINRPGESYNKEMFPKRGYEMLHYQITQGLDDLRSTLRYVYNNPLFKPSMVILVAFSMSALDARKIMIDPNNEKIDYLINVMGATCGQSSFGNVMGGMDIIGNARIGIQSGLAGVLGHLLDVDNIARDLIDNKYAYITDARLDMSKISTPVTWIYGKYDRWIPENEIIDMMSIKSDGMREVIEIPAGHNLRSSDDAIKTFKLITQLIYRMQFKKDFNPIAPDRKNMVALITYERERLENTEKFRPDDYWKQYLMGQGNSVGYDFYKNIKVFREFLTLQSELIGLENGEVFADIGCGTGIFIENMLLDLAERKKNINDTHLVLVDLVREALDKSKAKCEKIFKSYKSLVPEKIELIQMDLDPNRLIPVKKFVKEDSLDFNFLRNRIDGLMNITIDQLLQNNSPRLYAIMKGAVLTPDDSAYLKDIFSIDAYETILEFNRAARFINKDLFAHDMINEKYVHQNLIRDEDYIHIRTSDLIFKRLDFSKNGLEMNLNFKANYFNKIVASLFISYLYNPDDIIYDFYRMLKPGGRLLVSSMKPDSDISLIFTDYINKVQKFDLADTEIKDQEMNLTAARAMLNEAASLFELEEDGYFRFYSDKELVAMLENAGFKDITVTSSLGKPEQVVILTGEKPYS
ncbi:tRNA-specific adenosine deaminase TadA [Desulfotignum phosphitoxidans DSM 13687]|uniref:tRNA-specific adenosine deaminase TadA n=2 Tax=Desulfotignum phosphitoxidans TaxID=190898 RepID=S0G1M2_9BACT|nr:tRNA-specific adenosine deaminase TadA [Desulfotignum phosphitoxidans DSM 13687]